MKYTVNVNYYVTEWYKEGTKILHREDGPAVIYKDGSKIWFQNGLYHRLGGPACEWSDGHKVWWLNGNKHRLDGPAIEYANGVKFWFFQGNHVKCSSQEEFEKIIKERYINKANYCTDKIINIDGKNFKLVEI